MGDSGLFSPQAGSVLVFQQADSGSASLPADLGRADLALVDLDSRDSHLAGRIVRAGRTIRIRPFLRPI